MTQTVKRHVRGVFYTMPLNLANKYDELERKKNLLASRPPGATFGEVVVLEHECEAELQRLDQMGQITRRDGGIEIVK